MLALSGGLDSMVLLHLLARWLPDPALLQVVHVHHGLQPQADDWAKLCQRVTSALAVSCSVVRVTLSDQCRRGVEDRARQARYDALWQRVPEQGVLLTAHHQQDQAETFLLQALRGAGVAGLSAMSPWQVNPDGRALARPLLRVAPSALRVYAERHGLCWVEDPSNMDVALSRNRVRHQLLPVLTEAFPHAVSTLARAAGWAGEARTLLDEVAAEDWMRMQCDVHQWRLDVWAGWSWARARNALAWGWSQQGGARLHATHWEQIRQQMYEPWRQAAQTGIEWPQTHPALCWHGLCLLAEGGYGYLLPAHCLSRPAEVLLGSGLNRLHWGNWQLSIQVGGSACPADGQLWLRARQGGERVPTPQGRRSLKKWLQQQAVPAWQKAHWPVLVCRQAGGDEQVLGWLNLSQPRQAPEAAVSIAVEALPVAAPEQGVRLPRER